MSKGEDVMKPNKEQKGKNAVLVIAVGQHPKMGPGPRDYKKDKSMKKAFSLLKIKKSSKKERYEERKARREQKAKELEEYNAGTASDEVKQKIEQSRANTESGVNQNLRFANKDTGGSQQKRMPKKEKKPFDTTHYDRWVGKNSLGDKAHPNMLSPENLKVLAHKMGMQPRALQSKNFEGVDIGALKEAMSALGKTRYEQRKANRENRQDKWEEADPHADESYGDDDEFKEHDEQLDAADHTYRDLWQQGHEADEPYLVSGEDERRNIQGQLRERLGMSNKDRGHRMQEHEDEKQEGGVHYSPEENRQHAQEGSMVIPFSAGSARPGDWKKNPTRRAGRTLEQYGPRKRGGEATIEEELAGFMPPAVNTRLSSPQEEEDEAEEFPDYPQFLAGEPMELAFRLLKNSVCKGNDCDGCDKCKCKGNGKCKCSKCC